jgi:hypothetical protein
MNLSPKTVSRIIDLLHKALIDRGVVPRHQDSGAMFNDFIEHPVYDDSVVKMLLFAVIYKENGSDEPESCFMLAHEIFIDYQVLLLQEFKKYQNIEEFRATDFNPYELIQSAVKYEDDESEPNSVGSKLKAS